MPICSDEQFLMFFERGVLKDYGLAKLSDMRDNDTKGQSGNFAKKLHGLYSFLLALYFIKKKFLKLERVSTASVTIIAKHTGNNGTNQAS